MEDNDTTMSLAVEDLASVKSISKRAQILGHYEDLREVDGCGHPCVVRVGMVC